MMSNCETCGGEFVSGTIECLDCGARQFYMHVKTEYDEYMKSMEKGKPLQCQAQDPRTGHRR